MFGWRIAYNTHSCNSTSGMNHLCTRDINHMLLSIDIYLEYDLRRAYVFYQHHTNFNPIATHAIDLRQLA